MPFIVDTFVDSYRTAHAAGLIPMDVWRPLMRDCWRRILSRPGVRVVVAYVPGETSRQADLYGWIAVEDGHQRPFVLYVYVKADYRREGIARRLFEAAGIDLARPFDYAAKTGAVTRLRSKFSAAAQWRPLQARFPPPPQ